VYLLSTLTPTPRLMHDGKLPGCFVSDELLAKVQSERVEEHLERAAQQVAMYRALGAAGADIGGVPSFDMFTQILQRAAEIGTGWEQFKNNLHWPPRPENAGSLGGSVKADGLGDGSTASVETIAKLRLTMPPAAIRNWTSRSTSTKSPTKKPGW
jgi:hypothetical protein